MTDLAGTTTALFVFGDAHKDHYKESEGSVLILYSPKVSPWWRQACNDKWMGVVRKGRESCRAPGLVRTSHLAHPPLAPAHDKQPACLSLKPALPSMLFQFKRDPKSSSGFSLAVEKEQQVQRVGASPDLATCLGKKSVSGVGRARWSGGA